MRNPNFDAIFYPQTEKEFSVLLPPLNKEEAESSSIIMLPHAKLEKIAFLITSGISHLKQNRNILILSPSHSDKYFGIFKTEEKEFNSIYGTAKLSSFDFLITKEELFDSEYTHELMINSLMRYEKFRSSTFYPILCSIKSKKDIALLQNVITQALSEDFSIIITANLKIKDNKTNAGELSPLEKALSMDSSSAIDLKKYRLSSCADQIFQALRLFQFKTQFIQLLYDEITTDGKGDGSNCYASAVIKQ